MPTEDSGASDCVRFVFDGREASNHLVDAGRLGKSLIGIDKIANSGLIFLVHGREPRRRERLGFYIAAQSPATGSVEISAIIQKIPDLLPLAHEILVKYGLEYIEIFLSCVLLWHGGRKSEAQICMDKMIEIQKENNRIHAELIHVIIHLIDRLPIAARNVVEPVGRTAGSLLINGLSRDKHIIINEPTADNIRSKETMELQESREMTIRIDGIVKHLKNLKIDHPEIPGKFFTADVRDPAFDMAPNVYTESFNSDRKLKVLARPALRNGKLEKLYIMEALT